MAVGALFVGVSIGLVGIGGIFLIPILTAAGVGLEEAIGVSLVTFTVTGIVATAIYGRRGAIDWRSTVLTSLGSLAGGPFGAKLSVWLPEIVVSGCFAAFLLITGVTAIARRGAAAGGAGPAIAWPILVLCGLVVGVGSGLTGVGGPALLVPLLLLLKFPSGAAIAISQPNAIAASASGALGHLAFGRIDFGLAAALCVVAGTGVAAGAAVHRRVGAATLRRVVGAACIVLGIWLSGKLLQRLPGI